MTGRFTARDHTHVAVGGADEVAKPVSAAFRRRSRQRLSAASQRVRRGVRCQSSRHSPRRARIPDRSGCAPYRRSAIAARSRARGSRESSYAISFGNWVMAFIARLPSPQCCRCGSFVLPATILAGRFSPDCDSVGPPARDPSQKEGAVPTRSGHQAVAAQQGHPARACGPRKATKLSNAGRLAPTARISRRKRSPVTASITLWPVVARSSKAPKASALSNSAHR